MEAIGEGIKVIGNTLPSIAGWAGFVCVCSIISVTILIYTEKISFDDIKDFKRDKRGRYR